MELPFKPGDLLPDMRLGSMGGNSVALSGFRGRKTLVYVWASWCGCRENLGLLQEFHAANPDVAVVSIACDVQGVEHPMRYLRQAKATYEMWIDATCALARRWKLKRVSVTVLLDENGVVLAATADPLSREFLAKVAELLPRKPEKRDQPEPKVDHKDTQVEILMQACTNFLTRKRVDDAVGALNKALALDPENRVIPKQIWALQHPDRFYAGPIDKEWQKGMTPSI